MENEIVIWSETGTKDFIGYSYAQKFVNNDGGRTDAGFKGSTRDCVSRSIAIITGKPYKEVYDALNQISKDKGYWNSMILEKTNFGNSYKKKSSARTGVRREVYDEYLKSLGYKWVATSGIGLGCQVHLRGDELPKGKLIVRVTKHLTAVIDGVIHDNHDCSRRGTRCVYGYYIKDVDNLI